MEPDISLIAGLMGDATRARMLTALMGGKALTATELALEADITPQTASSHLSQLVEGQLLVVRKQGRHKYFQLQGTDVAELLENLLTLTASRDNNTVKTGPDDVRLRQARVCYDHMAGEMGVRLYDALVVKQAILDQGSETILTEQGKVFFQKIGFDFSNQKRSKRPICKSCLDWSERRNHLAGILGQWILEDTFAKGWATKDLDARSIRFSSKGLKLFTAQYGLQDMG